MNPFDCKILGYVLAILGAAVFLRGSSADSPLALVLGILCIGLSVAVNLLTWRCPHCKKGLPRSRVAVETCAGCGRSLFEDEEKEGEGKI